MDSEDAILVELVHLLQEDEGQDRVRPETEVVWCKTLPQGKESLIFYHPSQNICSTLVFGLP